jgi:hypothetical protein
MWAHVGFLDTQCPVQAEGWCDVGGVEDGSATGAWKFYFRARGKGWSVSASDLGDPVDVLVNDDHSYYYEELYEARTDDYGAGYMPQDVARYYLIRELEKLRSKKGAR